VRELRNVARRVAVASRGSARLQVDDALDRLLRRSEQPEPSREAQPAMVAAVPATSPKASERPAERRAPSEIDDEELRGALREHGFNLNRAAVALGVSRTWLNARIERAEGLRKAKDLSADEIARAQLHHGDDIEALAAALEVSPRGLQLQMKRLGMRS
jgi:DNA-binding NtrC family response regulator